MSAKHTPGPWEFYADTPSTDPDWHIVVNSSGHRVLANVHIQPGNETDLANARLISAAPEMLEALQAVVGAAGPESGPEIGMACAAIAKATGEAA